MTFSEKKLYHQIHPLKLLVDFSTGFFTTYLLWQHETVLFLIFFLAPSVIITIILMKFANLEKLKESALGHYVAKYMAPAIETVALPAR
jgi:hypothetical protein